MKIAEQLSLSQPANEVCKGYVFTRVCNSVYRGLSQHALQVSRGGGIPAYLAGVQAHTQG